MENDYAKYGKLIHPDEHIQADLTAERERAKELATKLEECQAELEKVKAENERLRETLKAAKAKLQEYAHADEAAKCESDSGVFCRPLEFIEPTIKLMDKFLKTEASDTNGGTE